MISIIVKSKICSPSLLIAERISARLASFSGSRPPTHNSLGTRLAMYVRTYVSVTLRNVNLHSFALICAHSFALTCTLRNHALRGLTMEVEDREEWRFLTMEDAEDSATGPPQRMCFAESSAERSRWLATLRKRKQRSQSTKEAKRARRERRK